MREVEGSLPGTPTNDFQHHDSTPNKGFGTSAFIARHFGTFEAEKVTSIWDLENLGKRLAKKSYTTHFFRTPEESEYINGIHRRREASYRLEPLQSGWRDSLNRIQTNLFEDRTRK